MKPSLTSAEYLHVLHEDFTSFVERSFYELNSDTTFVPGRYIDLLTHHMERCRAGEEKRLILNLPPRSLKSHIASVCFPAWILGHNPAEQIICVSYGQDLADKHARDCQRLINSSFYRAVFPGTRLSATKRAVDDFETTAAGFRLATSVGGVLTGRGADWIIIDDPMKPDEAMSETRRKFVNDWYYNSLLSRLNNKEEGRIVILMQRLHQDDLVGRILADYE